MPPEQQNPFITPYPGPRVRADITQTGPDLWANLIQTWAALIQFYLALPSSSTKSPSLRQFLETYVQETSTQDHASLSPLERTLRQGVFEVLVKKDADEERYIVLDSLSYSAVGAMITCYGLTNAKPVKDAINYLYAARGGKTFVNQLADVVIAELSKPNPPPSLAQTLSLVLTSGPGIAKDWATPKWFSALQTVYAAPATPPAVQVQVLNLCYATFCVPPLALLDSNAKIRALSDVVSLATSAPSTQSQLLSALLNYTNFAARVGVPSLAVTLETVKLRIPLVPSPLGSAPKQQKPKRTKDKGKGKTASTRVEHPPEENAEAVSMILDLFPQLSVPAVSALLSDHGGSAEVLTAHLLENPHVLEAYESYVPEVPAASPDAPVSTKVKSDKPKDKGKSKAAVPRSVYNDDDLLKADSSKLIFGKKQAPTLNSLGKAYNDDKTLQATLERIYQADEDEHDDTYDEAEASGQTSTTDDVETAIDVISHRTARKLGKNDPSITAPEPPIALTPEESAAAAKTDAIEQFLWARLKVSPGEFAQSARRTRARLEMRKQTGWADEQIEGWARMLERMPKRKAILEEKYAFKGNVKAVKPTAFRQQNRRDDNEGDEGEEEQQQQQQQTRTKRRPPPSGSSSQTAGGNNPANTKQQQQRKDRNKAKQGNHNRKAGHDKKMARGGAIP